MVVFAMDILIQKQIKADVNFNACLIIYPPDTAEQDGTNLKNHGYMDVRHVNWCHSVL